MEIDKQQKDCEVWFRNRSEGVHIHQGNWAVQKYQEDGEF